MFLFLCECVLEHVGARLLALVFCLGSKCLAFSATPLVLFYHFPLHLDRNYLEPDKVMVPEGGIFCYKLSRRSPYF